MLRICLIFVRKVEYKFTSLAFPIKSSLYSNLNNDIVPFAKCAKFFDIRLPDSLE